MPMEIPGKKSGIAKTGGLFSNPSPHRGAWRLREMQNHVHPAHLFSSNLDAGLKFYQEMFGAEILADLNMAGSRNIFMTV